MPTVRPLYAHCTSSWVNNKKSIRVGFSMLQLNYADYAVDCRAHSHGQPDSDRILKIITSPFCSPGSNDTFVCLYIRLELGPLSCHLLCGSMTEAQSICDCLCCWAA